MANKERKTNKKVGMLYYLSSVCFYIVAILNFVKRDNYSTGMIFSGLGSTCLCLGGIYLNKDDKNNNGNDKEQ